MLKPSEFTIDIHTKELRTMYFVNINIIYTDVFITFMLLNYHIFQVFKIQLTWVIYFIPMESVQLYIFLGM